MVRSAEVTVSVATVETAITMGVEPTFGVTPLDVTVGGILTDVSTGNGIGGKNVRIFVDGVHVRTVTTRTVAPIGSYSTVITIIEVGNHVLHSEFEGDAICNPCISSDVNVTVEEGQVVKKPSAITMNVEPTSGRVPLTVSITGTLYDPEASSPLLGKTVRLYRNGVLINTTNTLMVDPFKGMYSFSDTLTAAGSYTYQTEFLGDELYEGCEEGE